MFVQAKRETTLKAEVEVGRRHMPGFAWPTVMLALFTWTPHHDHSETGRYRNTRVSLWPGAELLLLGQNLHLIHHKIPAMCRAMDLPGRGFDDLHGAVVALLDRLDIPRRLADLGVEPGRAREIAEKALTDPAAATNPTPASLAQIEELLLEGIRQAR